MVEVQQTTINQRDTAKTTTTIETLLLWMQYIHLFVCLRVCVCVRENSNYYFLITINNQNAPLTMRIKRTAKFMSRRSLEKYKFSFDHHFGCLFFVFSISMFSVYFFSAFNYLFWMRFWLILYDVQRFGELND